MVGNLWWVFYNIESDAPAYCTASSSRVLGALHWFVAHPLLVEPLPLRPLAPPGWLVGGLEPSSSDASGSAVSSGALHFIINFCVGGFTSKHLAGYCDLPAGLTMF